MSKLAFTLQVPKAAAGQAGKGLQAKLAKKRRQVIEKK